MRKTLIGLGMALALSACATHSNKSMADSSESKMTKSYAGDMHACKRDADVRRIWITNASDEGGCKVMYEKYKQTQSLAEAQNDMSYCDRIQEKVVNNLQSAGYSCDMKTADRQDRRSRN